MEELDKRRAQQKQLKMGIEFILEECRMVLPGIQALFGFQLIAAFNQRFVELSAPDRYVHLAAILFTVGSVGLLMGPAAYHRQTMPAGLPPELCKLGTTLVRLGMATLMISISLDIYVVTNLIAANAILSITFGIASFLFLAFIWYVYPMMMKSKHGYGDLMKTGDEGCEDDDPSAIEPQVFVTTGRKYSANV